MQEIDASTDEKQLKDITDFDEQVETESYEEDINEKELNFSSLDGLNINKDKEIQRILSRRNLNQKIRYKNWETEALKITLKDILQSPVRPTFIPRKTKLINIETDEVYYTTKSINALAYSKVDFNKFRYIINNKGEVKFKTKASYLTNTSTITNLHHPPNRFQRVKKKIEVDREDSDFKYSLNFKFHGGLQSAVFSRSLIKNETDTTMMPLFRSEGLVLTNLDFLFQAGFSFIYETANSVATDSDQLNYQSLSFGPALRTHLLSENWYLELQPRLSIFSQVSSVTANKSFELSEASLLFSLGRERKFYNSGKYTYGFNFQRKWLKVNATDNAAEISSENNYDDSIAIFIGHRSDWIW